MPRRIAFKLPRDEKLKTALVTTAGSLLKTDKSPDEALGDLFTDVQKSKVYNDNKTFIDLVPRGRMKAIQKEYLLAKDDPNFDLREFVNRHFYEFAPHKNEEFHADPTQSVSQHIHILWKHLTRRNRLNRGSLIALPYPYIVPGGRFSELFYWDTYFIMRGLAVDRKWVMIENMVKNYAFMIRKFGYIPTANRTYFLSRSQPPFFSHMVKLLAGHKGRTRVLAEYLPYMLAEYRFWIKGKRKLEKAEHKAYARVVEMPNGMYLNRYYDNKMTPRPDTFVQDTMRADETPHREADRLYLHLRAAAESGWDFSSRWFEDPLDITSIHTADIVPVDLNCLLYQLEQTIAESYRAIKNPLLARKFQNLAERRAKAIQTYCWDSKEKFFVDYNFHHDKPTGQLSLAAVFPLYARIATKEQADAVAARLEKDFLKPGGLVSTLVNSGEQWDAPNGWAPLQLIAIEGLRHYGHHDLANEIKHRWIRVNMKVFTSHHKLVEKYDVEGAHGLGGGGEYPLQDGFGWTNGVLAALLAEH
ncbi:MAG TPA: alpha,alpha-trehalase TreF [Candidatus Saccharibacteria bacterium]|nr:alpha,alpha-trehalase TreF [Candidatus Saccharibacteria bacterium]